MLYMIDFSGYHPEGLHTMIGMLLDNFKFDYNYSIMEAPNGGPLVSLRPTGPIKQEKLLEFMRKWRGFVPERRLRFHN